MDNYVFLRNFNYLNGTLSLISIISLGYTSNGSKQLHNCLLGSGHRVTKCLGV